MDARCFTSAKSFPGSPRRTFNFHFTTTATTTTTDDFDLSSRPPEPTHDLLYHDCDRQNGRCLWKHLQVRDTLRRDMVDGGRRTNESRSIFVKRNAVFLGTIFVGAYATSLYVIEGGPA